MGWESQGTWVSSLAATPSLVQLGPEDRQAVLEVALVRLEAGSARNLVGKPILLTFPALKFQGAQAHL